VISRLLPRRYLRIHLQGLVGIADSLFEGEEAVLHVMGVQIASEKRRNPWTSARAPCLSDLVCSEKRRNPWTPGRIQAARRESVSGSEKRRNPMETSVAGQVMPLQRERSRGWTPARATSVQTLILPTPPSREIKGSSHVV
jgi:hypothetical protein